MLAGDQVDHGQVAEIIQQQFPELHPASVSYVGEGCDSAAFDVNSRWVFRFPKRADVEQQLLVEFRVLPILAGRSPLALPAYCFHGRPSELFPRHFGGYAKLPGVPGIRVDPHTVPFGKWAPVLAQFLSWLHAFPVDDAAKCGVPREDVAALVEEVRTDALDDFHCLGQVAPDAPLERWHDYVTAAPSPPAARSSRPVVVHRDLAAEHVLCDVATSALTGVIDWSDIAIGDGLVDFAGIFHWGGAAFVNAVLADYDGPVGEAELTRACYLAACRGVADVAFGLEMNRPEYIDAGIRALSLCVGR